MNKLEREFKKQLKKKLKSLFKDSIVIDMNPNDIQGLPDILILYGNTWASLECKRQTDSSHRPNQDYYVDKMNFMSFSRFIYPENEEEVLNELRKTFESRRPACLSRSKQVSLD